MSQLWYKLLAWTSPQKQNNRQTTESKEYRSKVTDSERGFDCFTLAQTDSERDSRIKLKKSFRRNHVLRKVREDQIKVDAEEQEEGDSEVQNGHLILPRTGVKNPMVPNCCIICLEPYQEGETIVWSSNKSCHHAFHEACMLRYLIRTYKKAESTPCCVCRCNFTDLKVEPRVPQPTVPTRIPSVRRGPRRGRSRRRIRTDHNFDARMLPPWLFHYRQRERH